MRSEGYCSCFVCVCNVLREIPDVNVKVDVPTQYNFFEMNINGGFFFKMLHSREMAMSL